MITAEPVEAPAAPATFLGMQEGFGPIPAMELYNLTAQVGRHPAGSTVSRQTLEQHGYQLPARSWIMPAALPASVRHAAAKATMNLDWLVPQKQFLRIREIAGITGMGETFLEDEFKAAQKYHGYNGGNGLRESIRVPRLFVVELLIKSAKYDSETKVDAVLTCLREFSGTELLRIVEEARRLAAQKGSR